MITQRVDRLPAPRSGRLTYKSVSQVLFDFFAINATQNFDNKWEGLAQSFSRLPGAGFCLTPPICGCFITSLLPAVQRPWDSGPKLGTSGYAMHTWWHVCNVGLHVWAFCHPTLFLLCFCDL
ncbi:hypothetical protein I7I52_10169 [Histoplasma capsulatum]|uniref:Uncharacterized protein n=1 Tax=Ajellomyces capsulatus TaxID=5037 RepID=A0A8H7YXE2_AJECA|nr:hypothetical protein I7I52_10169 [Histoplasma capsulatum]